MLGLRRCSVSESGTTNMAVWGKLNRPPATALKRIMGGRLAGMSDINPQWRYKALTEAFGPCGIGWKYEVVRLWTEPGTDGQVFANAQVNLFVRQDEKWSEALPGVGGSMLIQKETQGLHCNDEAFKMAVTDAIGTAGKTLGLAADIYLRLWDGSKYIDQPSENDEEKASKELDWLAALDEVASQEDAASLRSWWKDYGDQVKADCGEAKAAKVYARYGELLKEAKAPVGAS